VANIKSAKKRVLVIAKKSALNKSNRSSLKTSEKRFLEAIEAGDKALATEKFKAYQSQAMKMGAKNTIHANKASRKVSRMQTAINKLD